MFLDHHYSSTTYQYIFVAGAVLLGAVWSIQLGPSSFLPPQMLSPPGPAAVGLQPLCWAAAALGAQRCLTLLHICNSAFTRRSVSRGFTEREIKPLHLMQSK